ncbi:MAG: hypothetical protein DLM53_05260 [Candidatus Eremiobacter antarcticus]|nr:prepilin-type N-terminal cleavage/methylation domain-containing protein [Candidatus Eremiobacteraeota bacterium]MBC5807058.1 prepilin-type N-terminal cleavage/methylation domain-containing protein [Candidatus Eremiobacteraeota bacterium]PZR62814.1 MAG: hypothetical protein DLM53_05260 [Candidatus Eremiobacter sp. RRmetagenome_bin22]
MTKTRNAAVQGGYTLIEFMIAIFILLLFFAVGYLTLFPIMSYLNSGQAKIATQANAVPLLYKLQRETRQSDYRAIYIMPASAATSLPTTLTDVTRFAVATAKIGTAGSSCFPGGDFDTVPGYGQPMWHGFEVFMLENATLKCAYEPFSPAQQAFPTSGQATTAINSALALANPPVFGAAVLDIKIKADPTAYVTDFLIKAISTVNGRSNATTYTEDILTRN